ncbi:MAG: hypothetical protein M1813_001437 [Trichoglossum hirsutum]|nr:MAG: hypothetical protein M1813_001437 [Trichoglossum hirsutum]
MADQNKNQITTDDYKLLDSAEQEVSARFADLMEHNQNPVSKKAYMAYHSATRKLEGLRSRHEQLYSLQDEGGSSSSSNTNDGKPAATTTTTTKTTMTATDSAAAAAAAAVAIDSPPEPCTCRHNCMSVNCACVRAGAHCTLRCRRGVHHQCRNLSTMSVLSSSPPEAALKVPGASGGSSSGSSSRKARRSHSRKLSASALSQQRRKPLTPDEERVRRQGQKARVRNELGLATYGWMKTADDDDG